jgi:outer membrane protein OmpA-like peptidoglycan-associated protein
MNQRFTLSLVVFCFFSISLHAQSSTNYYVIIGVFKRLDNATRLVDKANKQGYTAEYATNASNQLNYVYVAGTSEKRKAYAQAVKLRVETEYKDAWVYEGQLGDAPIVKMEPVVEKKEEPVVEIKPIEPEPQPAIDSTLLKRQEPEKPVVVEVPKPKGKPFYFKLRNTYDNSEVKSGEVHIQEAIKATQYQAFKPGEVVYLEAPKNKQGAYTIITQVAGYSPIKTVFNYQNPAGDKGPDGEVIIELPVVKAKKGDYVDFNNVKFYKNASILQASAQSELDGLVDLMKENPKYEIRVHGHVNGTQEREAFTRGPNSGFFATNPSADVTTKGMSAKDLSAKRAEMVRDYLVTQGIEAKRMSIKGEGGKIPLYPEGGTLGQLNDRVEIEFVKSK